MKALLKALLLPIARLALRNGLCLPELVEILKASLFEAAFQNLEKRGEPVTASRVSVMTGLHRKDSSQFLKGVDREPTAGSLSIKVIGAWQAKKRYRLPSGQPKRLTLGNEDSEFARLVREVSADVHAYTVLKELERLELVAVKDGEARLLRTGYISSSADEATADLLSRDSEDLLVAVEENVHSKGARPNHHTSTEYDNIPIEYAAELRDWIVAEGAAFHRKVREHVSRFDRDLAAKKLRDEKGETIRFVFCSFSRTQTIHSRNHE